MNEDIPVKKPKIAGQMRHLREEEAESVQQMIQDAQQSSRTLYIPNEDLNENATISMDLNTQKVIAESKVKSILQLFNRDYLYGQGRFDEYESGLILKWGDGYSRKHIWIKVDGENLIFETSHYKKCDKPFCTGNEHVLTPEQWQDWSVLNQELGDRFRRPVYEPSED